MLRLSPFTKTTKPAVTKVCRSYHLYPKAGVRLRVVKKATPHRECSPIYAMVMLLYRTPQLTLEHDTVVRRTCMMAASKKFAFKNAAKALQIETWLLGLLTAHRNSSAPYPTVPSPTPYDVRFNHNTCITDDDGRHIMLKTWPNNGPKILQ